MISFLLSLFVSVAPAQNITGKVIRLTPTTLPSTCKDGDIRYNTANGYPSKCTSNTWTAFSLGAFTSPLTTTGDMIYSSSGSTAARLAIGSANQVLLTNGTIPVWSSSFPFTSLSGTISVAQAGTYLGDIATTQVTSGTFALARLGTIPFTSLGGTISVAQAGSYLGDIATSQVTSGTFAQARLGTYIGSVAASQLDSGTLAIARIGSLDASIIGDGTFAQARLGTYLGSVAASQVDSGTLAVARIGTYLGDIAASQVASGTLATARLGTYIGSIAGSQVDSGTLAIARIPHIDTLLPSQSGNSGKFLTTNATTASWGAVTVTPTVQSKAADYTALTTDDFLISTAAATFTLPAASNSKLYTFKNTSSTTTGTVSRAGSDVIYNGNGTISVLLPNQYDSVTMQSDGSASWHVIHYNRPPKITNYTSGSGTHVPTNGTKYIRVVMVGGGGGGAGSCNAGCGAAAGAGTTGVASTFGSSLLTANPGVGPSGPGAQVAGGAGGTATIAAPASGIAMTGATGEGNSLILATATVIRLAGGYGGGTPFAGPQGGVVGAGVAAVANSGGGGSGAGIDGTTDGRSGPGGGAGGYIDAVIPGPLSYGYAYTVGTGGGGGTAGTGGGIGGAGAAGRITVYEYFQ